jgi:hypothetical protein
MCRRSTLLVEIRRNNHRLAGMEWAASAQRVKGRRILIARGQKRPRHEQVCPDHLQRTQLLNLLA